MLSQKRLQIQFIEGSRKNIIWGGGGSGAMEAQKGWSFSIGTKKEASTPEFKTKTEHLEPLKEDRRSRKTGKKRPVLSIVGYRR